MVFCYGSLMVFLFSGSAVVPPTKGPEKGICSKNLRLQPNCYEKQRQTHDKHKNCKEKPEDGQKVYAYANCGGGQLQFAKQNLTENVKTKQNIWKIMKHLDKTHQNQIKPDNTMNNQAA